MKISIIITEGAKQIMMTPETDHEKEALKFISPDDILKVISKWGTFSNENKHVNYHVGKCEGGYHRLFEDRESLMFVIEKDKENSR